MNIAIGEMRYINVTASARLLDITRTEKRLGI